jgi:hypothetical protein
MADSPRAGPDLNRLRSSAVTFFFVKFLHHPELHQLGFVGADGRHAALGMPNSVLWAAPTLLVWKAFSDF